MKIGNVVAAVLGMVVTACVSPSYDYVPLSREISEPPLDVVSVAMVGDSMVRQGRFSEHEGIRLAEKVSIGIFGSYAFSPGEYRKTGQSGDGEYFLPSGGPGSGNVSVSPIADPFQVILLKKDGQICGVSTFNASFCATTNGLKRVKVQIVAEDAFQQTLIYSGKVGDKINIGYREFSGNMARPAFNNDVEYDLKESTTIGYKGALIQVIEATNQQIRYKVVRNFNRATD